MRYALRAGEHLAIDPGVVHHDADGFYFNWGPQSPDNEQVGTVSIVHVRGALAHYKGDGGDSYEGIVERVGKAFGSNPKPSAVVLRIDSPGGVVSGLNECVLKLQRMSKASGVALVAYVDEMAASAAYALCCACSEVLAPPSGVIGSVGVVSTMVSMAKRDAMEGIEFRLITSGKRKSDGHPHVPISDDAVRAETGRNTELATQFFALASKARGLSPRKLQSLEAAIYLGKDAAMVGLIDDVMGLDDALIGLDATDVASTEAVAPNDGNVTDRRAKSVPKAARKSVPLDKTAQLGSSSTAHNGTARAGTMSVKLSAKIKKLEAEVAAELDPRKRAPIQSRLAVLMAAKAEMDDDDGGDGGGGGEDDEDDDDDDESKASKAKEAAAKAKSKAEAAKHRAKAAEHKSKAAEYEEMAKKCEEESSGGEEDDEDEDEEEKAKALVAAGLSEAAAAAISEQARLNAANTAKVTSIEAKLAKREQTASIKEALADGRITPHEAKMLEGKTPAWAQEYIATREGVRVVVSDEGHMIMPVENGVAASKAELEEIHRRIAQMGVKDPEAVKKLSGEMLENRRKAAQNGVGRY